uniref:Non-structural protein 1 n=1 Tax=Ornate chorus frog influenza-like virus TaxID=2777033 RepID=A0A866VZT1_9ORTO|nr:nonstructural protein [Ornate chorus frog influenza-like virus]
MSENKSVTTTNVKAAIATRALLISSQMDTTGVLTFKKMLKSAEKSWANEQSYAERTWEEAIEEGERILDFGVAPDPTSEESVQIGKNKVYPIGRNKPYLMPCTGDKSLTFTIEGCTIGLKMRNCNCSVKTVQMVSSSSGELILLFCRNVEKPSYVITTGSGSLNPEGEVRRILRKFRCGFTVAIDEKNACAFRRYKLGCVADPYWRRKEATSGEIKEVLDCLEKIEDEVGSSDD